MAEHVIVGLDPLKRRTQWRKCVLDSGDAFEVPLEIVMRERLSVGGSLSDRKVSWLRSAAEIARGKEQALRLLAVRERGENELRRRMQRSGIGKSAAAEIIDGLKNINLIDDEAFARKFVNDLIRRKPAGALLIKAELKRKGISDPVADRVLQETFAKVSPIDLARRGVEQWVKRHPHTAASVERRHKLSQYLYRRGFTWSTIDEVMGDSSAV